jgi:hypothetical protein
MAKLLFCRKIKTKRKKMQLEITEDVLISQLGYSKNEHTIIQAKNIMQNTKNFSKFAKHIISLNDNLKHINAFVAFSNSQNYLKIKCDSCNNSPEILEEFSQTTKNFSNKYNVNIKKLPNKEVYYIIGTN